MGNLSSNLPDVRKDRRILHFLHVGKTGDTTIKTALRPHVCSGLYLIFLQQDTLRLKQVPPGERSIIFFLLNPVILFQPL